MIIITDNRHVGLLIMHFAFCKVPTKRTFIDHKLAQQRGEIAPSACFFQPRCDDTYSELGKGSHNCHELIFCNLPITHHLQSQYLWDMQNVQKYARICKKYAQYEKCTKICKTCKVCKIFPLAPIIHSRTRSAPAFLIQEVLFSKKKLSMSEVSKRKLIHVQSFLLLMFQ